ncbi:MAG: phosphotransferase [Rhodospirillales bacterium]
MAVDVQAEMDRVRGLPCWQGDIDIAVLSGGLSNLNFTVVDGGRRFVVRMVGGDEPIHNVMRFNEVSGLNAAHAVGLTPALVYGEPGVMVVDFIDGKTYEAGDVADTDNLNRIIGAVRTLHEQAKDHVFGPCLGFWVFRVHRSYANLLREGNSRMLPQLDRFMAISDELEAAVGPVTVTFCHNDLLCANFIDDSENVWIIDWEHCGYGARLFDLANIASNAQLTEDTERAMLESYYGFAPDATRWRRYKAFRAGSHLREAMWSMASEIHLDLDIDYVAYTQENLDAFEVAYQEFKKL